MFETLDHMLGMVLMLAPHLILALIVFHSGYRYRVRTCVLLFLVLIALHITYVFVFLPNVPDWQRWRAPYSTPFLVLYMALALHLVSGISVSQWLFVTFLLKSYADVVSTFSHYLEHVLLTTYGPAQGLSYLNIAQLLMLLVTYPAMVFVCIKYLAPLMRSSPRPWRFLWTVSLALMLIYFAFTLQKSDLVTSWQFMLFNVIFFSASCSVYFFVLKMLAQTEQSTILSEGVKAMENQLALQAAQYAQFTEYVELSRKADHDLHHHLVSMQQMAAQGDLVPLQGYLEKLLGQRATLSVATYCHHNAVNALLNFYAARCKEEGIDLTISVDLPATLGIEENRLCVVFGNLIKNAVEACMRKASPNRFVRISSCMYGDQLVLTIDNSYEGTLIPQGDIFLSTHHDGRAGIGLSSVQAIAMQHRGTVTFAAADQQFHASVLMHVDDALSPVGTSHKGALPA